MEEHKLNSTTSYLSQHKQPPSTHKYTNFTRCVSSLCSWVFKPLKLKTQASLAPPSHSNRYLQWRLLATIWVAAGAVAAYACSLQVLKSLVKPALPCTLGRANRSCDMQSFVASRSGDTATWLVPVEGAITTGAMHGCYVEKLHPWGNYLGTALFWEILFKSTLKWEICRVWSFTNHRIKVVKRHSL